MRAAQIALVDAMLFRLGDAVPGVEDQQIVDAAVLQRERRQLDDIDQLARLDEHVLIRLDIDRAELLLDRITLMATATRFQMLPLPSSHPNLLPKPPQDVAEPTPACCQSHPRMLPIGP